MGAVTFDTSALELLHANDGARAAKDADGAGFGEAMTNALSGLESSQQGADAQANALANGAGNLHETALALEKADVAMRLAVRVRNKLVDAYNEVMRMPL